MTGRKPFVTCHGYLMPCCWFDIPRYSTNGKIRDDNWELAENIFLRDAFDLKKRSYEDIINSEEWLLVLEQLKLLQYHPCKMKCSNMLLVDGRVEHDEEKLDQAVIDGTLEQSIDKRVFSKHFMHPGSIDTIQLELTNRCSLKCPYCPRQTDMPKNADIPFFVLDDVMTSKHWRVVDDVGNYGDSIFYPHYHDFIRLLISCSVDLYLGHIAATGRPKIWWWETINEWGRLVDSGTEVKIYWGIDGLEETSKKHRIGQNWDEIVYAMKMAADVGVKSVWQWIPMSFNEHEIDKAKELANQWGVELYIHTSCRFRKGDPNIPKNPNYHRDLYNVRV